MQIKYPVLYSFKFAYHAMCFKKIEYLEKELGNKK